jgi:hypothetical protein
MSALFERRHYEWLARWVNGLPEPARAQIGASLANGLSWDNKRFNRDRFLKACGIEPRVPVIPPTPAIETCDSVFIASLRESARK